MEEYLDASLEENKDIHESLKASTVYGHFDEGPTQGIETSREKYSKLKEREEETIFGDINPDKLSLSDLKKQLENDIGELQMDLVDISRQEFNQAEKDKQSKLVQESINNKEDWIKAINGFKPIDFNPFQNDTKIEPDILKQGINLN